MNHMRTCAIVLAAAALLGVFAAVAPAQEKPASPDPAAFVDGVLANPNLGNKGTGEWYCWHASAETESFLNAYLAYQDTRWLDAAIKDYDAFIAKLHKDPDGYEGWIGDVDPPVEGLSTDEVVGDALLCAPLARFAEIVLKDPKLKDAYGKKAQQYLDLATRICWEKYNHRGCYYEDAAGWGSYHTYGKLVDLKANKWVDAPNRTISDNLNKHYRMGLVLLRLWRATGKDEYKDRVLKIYGRSKTMWRYFPAEDRITWNFWMPHGPYDMKGRSPRSWVAVHPSSSGYQAGEVQMFAEVYDSGLVYEQADMEKFIHANHWMAEGPGGWRSSDGSTKAGTLWTALARFDEEIRKKYEASLAREGAEGQIGLAYLKWEMAKAPGFARLYVSDPSKVQVVKTPLQPGAAISAAVIIPNAVELVNKDRVQLFVQTRAKGKLKIELLDANGTEALGILAEIDTNGDQQDAPFWDGTNPKTGQKDVGQYQVRWTLNGESRMSPVWVKQGTPRKKEGPEAMKPGETLTADFESPLDKRWKLENAALSTEQAHGGKASLKVGGTAQFTFGSSDDLPVTVRMWVYDAGGKFGKTVKNGPAWGIESGAGDQFCAWMAWRAYTDGDNTYAWVNSAENAWFNPHPGSAARKSGWVEWVFDFNDPKNVKITGDGKAIGALPAKFTPAGAASIYLKGGDGLPLYVDDITVEYPKK
jgi:hypothetical protein